MGKLEIQIHNPPVNLRRINWTHDIHYCGPTITNEGIKNCCNNYYLFIERLDKNSDNFSLTRNHGNKEIFSFEKGEENVHNKAEKIMRGLARLIKIKLIPEELREDVEIIEY